MNEHGDDADADFLLAMQATARLVKQGESHARLAIEKLNSRTKAAARSSPHGTDRERVQHPLAFERRLDDVENASNTLAMHLLGVVNLLKGSVFFPWSSRRFG